MTRSQQQKTQFQDKLNEQQEWIEQRLTREITRTDTSERDMEKVTAKFAKHLQTLSYLHQESEMEHEATLGQREDAMWQLRDDARIVLDQRKVQTDLELLLEARLNEDGLDQATHKLTGELSEHNRQYMKLFADHHIQKTHLANSSGENRKLKLEMEHMTREKEAMSAQIKYLEVRHAPAAVCLAVHVPVRSIETSDVTRKRRRRTSSRQMSPAPSVSLLAP